MTDSYLVNRSAKDWKKSDKHGAGEWLAERGTSLALIPLTLWAVYSGYTLSGQGIDAALAFVKVPLNAGLIGLIFALSCWHMFMGLKVVVDDYLQGGLRGLLNFLILLFSLSVFGAAAYALFLLVRS